MPRRLRVILTITYLLLAFVILSPLVDAENRGRRELIVRVVAAAVVLVIGFIPVGKGGKSREP